MGQVGAAHAPWAVRAAVAHRRLFATSKPVHIVAVEASPKVFALSAAVGQSPPTFAVELKTRRLQEIAELRDHVVLNDIAPRDVTIWRAAVGVERAWSTFNTQACALKGGGHKPPPTTQQREEGGPRPASRWSRGEFIAGVGGLDGGLEGRE